MEGRHRSAVTSELSAAAGSFAGTFRCQPGSLIGNVKGPLGVRRYGREGLLFRKAEGGLGRLLRTCRKRCQSLLVFEGCLNGSVKGDFPATLRTELVQSR